MTRSRIALLLLCTLFVPACDTLTPDAGAPSFLADLPESEKLQHWDLLEGVGMGGGTNSAALDSVSMIVTFRNGVTDPVAASDSVFYGQEVRRRTYYRDSFVGVSITVPLVDMVPILGVLLADPLVALVEPDISIIQALPLPTFLTEIVLRLLYALSEWFLFQVRPWSVRTVDGHESWTQSGNGSGTVDADVYVIDGPIQHPDINVVERINLLPEGSSGGAAMHGTHVAGLIGAVDDGNGIVGIAPGARIHSLEVLAADGTTSLSALLDAVELVTERKRADRSRPIVANMSIGRDIRTTRLNALDRAIAAAVSEGVVFVVSAGNNAADAATFSPAHAPGVITVGATTRSDRFASDFSNTGSTVDILAPGDGALSTGAGGLWATMSGTSMAASHVSGAAALFLARNPGTKPAGVLSALIDQAEDATHVPAGTTTRRLNVRNL